MLLDTGKILIALFSTFYLNSFYIFVLKYSKHMQTYSVLSGSS